MPKYHLSIQVVNSGGSPKLQSITVIPQKDQYIINPSYGYDGFSQITVSGDSNFVADNIANGVKIWGVTGTYSGPKYIGWKYFNSQFTSDYKSVLFTLPDGIEATQILGGYISGTGNTRKNGIYEIQRSDRLCVGVLANFYAYATGTYDNELYGFDEYAHLRYTQSSSSKIYYQSSFNFADVNYQPNVQIQVAFINNRSFQLTIYPSTTVSIKGIGNSTSTNLSTADLYFQSNLSFGFYYTSNDAT